MNLGTWRIAIIVALVVIGVAVLANGFDENGGAIASPTTSVSPAEDGEGDGTVDGEGNQQPEPTDEPEPTPAPNKTGVKVKVFNGTDVAGLAAQVTIELEEAGHISPEEPTDAPAPAAKTTIYFRGGADADQNQADATYIAKKFMRSILGRMPKIEELSADFVENVDNSITVVVLLGEDYGENAPPPEG